MYTCTVCMCCYAGMFAKATFIIFCFVVISLCAVMVSHCAHCYVCWFIPDADVILVRLQFSFSYVGERTGIPLPKDNHVFEVS